LKSSYLTILTIEKLISEHAIKMPVW